MFAHSWTHSGAPLQAIAAWRDSTMFGRCLLVKQYLAAAGGFGEAEVVQGVNLDGSAAAGGAAPLERLQGWLEGLWQGGSKDPFYAVVATRLEDQ